MKLEFTAYGEPKPAGSKRPFRRGDGKLGVRDDCAKTKSWQYVVSTAALAMVEEGLMVENAGEIGTTFLQGALTVSMRFYTPRPKDHYGSGKNASKLKDSAPGFVIKRPDVLKLARAVEDAMTGIVYRDDAQIVQEHLFKSYGEPARVEVTVATLAAPR